MRIFEFLQKLNAKSLQLASKRQSGIVVFILSAPSAQQLKDTREHLLYWPYVKAFRPVDETHMNVQVLVGRGVSETQWKYYVTRSCELMNLCVRQHQALFVTTKERPTFWLHQYHRNGFLRPDDLLKPFCDFIDELDSNKYETIHSCELILG